ncbi:MAG TPA: hypothetical protein VIK78_00370 [Ruminiclostridium sp.]
MLTQIIYDDSGFIISQMQGSSLREPVGIPFLNIEIPEKKRIVSVDVSASPNVPVYEDIPLTETEILQVDQTLQTTRLSQMEADNLAFTDYVLETLGGM